MTEKYRLLNLEVEEVSLVADPANPEAKVLITKAKAGDGMKCPKCGEMNEKGATECAKCGYAMKAVNKENNMDLEKDLKAAEELAEAEQAKRVAAEAEVAELKKEVEDLKKAAETPEVIEKRKLEALPAEFRKRLEDAEAEIKKGKEEKAEAVAIAKCKESFPNLKGTSEANAKLYRKAVASMSAEEVNAFDELLKSASEAMKSNLFSARGSDGTVSANATSEFEAKVAEIQKADPKLTYKDAMTKVAREHPALFDRHRAATMAVN